MSRTTGARPTSGRLAFWGYTNARSAQAAVNIARQLRACEAALDGRGEVTRFFWDMPRLIDDLMVLAVRGAGGPERRDGGWDDLAAALSADGRDFDTIICESPARVGRRTTQLYRLALVADHGATVLYADQPLLALPWADGPEADRLLRWFTVALHEHDYVTVDALVQVSRGCTNE